MQNLVLPQLQLLFFSIVITSGADMSELLRPGLAVPDARAGFTLFYSPCFDSCADVFIFIHLDSDASEWLSGNSQMSVAVGCCGEQEQEN